MVNKIYLFFYLSSVSNDMQMGVCPQGVFIAPSSTAPFCSPGKTKVVKMTAAPLRIDGSEDAAQGSIPDVPVTLVFKM